MMDSRINPLIAAISSSNPLGDFLQAKEAGATLSVKELSSLLNDPDNKFAEFLQTNKDCFYTLCQVFPKEIELGAIKGALFTLGVKFSGQELHDINFWGWQGLIKPPMCTIIMEASFSDAVHLCNKRVNTQAALTWLSKKPIDICSFDDWYDASIADLSKKYNKFQIKFFSDFYDLVSKQKEIIIQQFTKPFSLDLKKYKDFERDFFPLFYAARKTIKGIMLDRDFLYLWQRCRNIVLACFELCAQKCIAAVNLSKSLSPEIMMKYLYLPLDVFPKFQENYFLLSHPKNGDFLGRSIQFGSKNIFRYTMALELVKPNPNINFFIQAVLESVKYGEWVMAKVAFECMSQRFFLLKSNADLPKSEPIFSLSQSYEMLNLLSWQIDTLSHRLSYNILTLLMQDSLNLIALIELLNANGYDLFFKKIKHLWPIEPTSVLIFENHPDFKKVASSFIGSSQTFVSSLFRDGPVLTDQASDALVPSNKKG